MIDHIKVEQKYSNSMILVFLHLESKFTNRSRFSSKLDAQCALNDSTFNVNQFFALLLLDNTSQIYKRKWSPKKYKKRCLMYVEGSLIPIELGLNLEANFKILYHGNLNLLHRMN